MKQDKGQGRGKEHRLHRRLGKICMARNQTQCWRGAKNENQMVVLIYGVTNGSMFIVFIGEKVMLNRHLMLALTVIYIEAVV